jgi:hypothetical protein
MAHLTAHALASPPYSPITSHAEIVKISSPPVSTDDLIDSMAGMSGDETDISMNKGAQNL